MEKQAFIDQNLGRLFNKSLTRALFWAAAAFVFLGAVDYFAAPGHFVEFMYYRVAAAMVLSAIALGVRRLDNQDAAACRAKGYAAVIVSAAVIEIMIMKTGGHVSHYYFGMLLLAVSAMFLVPAWFPFHLTSAFLIYAIYIVPIAASDELFEYKEMFDHNILFCSVLATGLLLRYANEKVLVSELGMKFDLHKHQVHLERKVADRTMELSKTVDALRRERDFSEKILDTANALIFVMDSHAKIELFNRECERLSGYTQQEAIGHSPLEFLVREDCRDKSMSAFRRLIAGEDVSCSNAWVTRTGEEREISWSLSVLDDANGGGKHAIAIGIDITEQKQAEKRLLDARAYWEETFDTISDVITVHDADYNIVRANKAAQNMLGMALNNGDKVKCFRHYHGTPTAPKSCPSCDCIKNGKEIVSEMYEPHLGRYIEIRAIPRKNKDGEITGVIHAVRDISDRKKAEETISRQMERLSALRMIDMAINNSLDLGVTLNVLLEQATTRLGVDAADVLLLTEHTRELEFAAGRGFRTSLISGSRISLGQGYAGCVALEKKAVRVPDLSAQKIRPIRSLIDSEGFAAYFGVPLIAKGKVKGVLEIYSRKALYPETEWFEFLEAIAGQAAIALDNATMFNDIQTSRDELMTAYDMTIEGWSRALDYRDKETEGHSRRVTELTIRVARALNIKDEELEHIRRGALLHDIGKLGVPDSILLKEGPLTEEEWVIMKKHPVIAYEVLSPIPFLRHAIHIPYSHHEKWDGTGYPRGLAGEQIPLAARIFKIVDEWDALLSDRPYRKAWPREKVIERLKSQSGTHFDPAIVEAFLKIV